MHIFLNCSISILFNFSKRCPKCYFAERICDTRGTASQLCMLICLDTVTVKPVLSGHSKINKTKSLMTNDSLMKVKSITEGAFRNILT